MKRTKIEVKTRTREELIDLTQRIQDCVSSSGTKEGMCCVFVPHTTAGITINENADPSVRSDLLMTLKTIVPDSLPYTHLEGNSPAHVKASLMGSSVQVIVQQGKLWLGTWQGIFLAEFDGPRTRRVFVELTDTS
jgi:secondary thiamine-phosphate synthase enzyme